MQKINEDLIDWLRILLVIWASGGHCLNEFLLLRALMYGSYIHASSYMMHYCLYGNVRHSYMSVFIRVFFKKVFK